MYSLRMKRLTSGSSRNARRRALFELVEWQVGFGARFPGTPEHALFRQALTERLEACADECFTQTFQIELLGETGRCSNLIGVFRARTHPDRGPLLVGTHFDTRLQADNEPDPERRREPILGANDGGSGTAILLHLAAHMREVPTSRDVHLVLFDAEDVGNISGNAFSMGARFLASNPLPQSPSEVIVLDMVGGRDMILDIDAHIMHHHASRALTERIFALGRDLAMQPFTLPKPGKKKYIISDHIPFLINGIPSCILIDIDYAPWHTHGDTPQAVSPDSLVLIEHLLLAYLSRDEGQSQSSTPGSG